MSHRYVPLPNPRPGSQAQRDQEEEMAAAFDYSEDDDDNDNDDDDSDSHSALETQPLNPQLASNTSRFSANSGRTQSATVPSTYDFENVDYDYPPPGSPPIPSSTALPNNIGNSNGLIPSFHPAAPPFHMNWLRRTAAAVLPPQLVHKFRIGYDRPSGPVGSGSSNDGVFANVTAKPTPPMRIQQGDDTYLVPEETRNDTPPSYQSAQADAVPPYWETTVHAPLSPNSAGEMIIDSLPTGSVFSFLWNMLVSVSFQFVGFLLTYLLHTTHAARLGSRAGLGVTLIQYGFALRGKLDEDSDWQTWHDPSRPPPFTSGGDSDPFVGQHHAVNLTSPTTTGPVPNAQSASSVADATTEWLSFFLMTVGWFILLTSLLGFWRVKRWERGILASHREPNTSVHSSEARNLALFPRLEQVFGLRGVSGASSTNDRNRTQDEDEAMVRAENGQGRIVVATTQHPPLPLDPTDAERNRQVLRAIEYEHRLRTELRNAGLA